MSISGYGRAATWPRLNTRAWFAVTLTVMAVLLTVSAAAAVLALGRSTAAADEMTRRVAPGLLAAERLRGALLDQEAGVHGYIVSGRQEFTTGFEQGLARERASVATLRRSLADSTLLADLDLVEVRAGTWREGYARPMIEAVRVGGAGTADPARVAAGNQLFDRIRAAMDQQAADLERAQARAEAGFTQTRLWRNLVLAAILAVFVLTLLLVALLLRYAVLRPLDRLGAAARRVANGEFGHVIDIRGPSDLTMLAADVDAMRRRISAELSVSRDAQRRLQEQADLLAEQTEELRRSNSELEQFAYVASHDLQEPVRKVTAFCQLLQRRYGDRLDERANEYIAFAVDGAKRMQMLISELLTFSRVGRGNNERVPVPLRVPLDRALANLETLAEESGAVVFRPELPEVLGDEALLTMLWQNLLGNAMKFRSADRPPRIQITAERAGDLWEVAVRDNGIGVEPRFADKIFVIFQRLHDRGEYEGTGIGLALCKKIVEYHGGTIRLDAGQADGSAFVFTLPAVPDGAAAEPATGRAAAPLPAPGSGGA
ncbi:histidine kinase [Sphaerisporangium melleum]|uniref:histidine kinase n=1 Tax=Sphaerisporangium melleum TaxID=321316 RepID=A0A917R5K9_9ACTN|nr:sensor histidine kinase [Sphaerisporangium melleum]GGK89901.1 histidine kinase [Sphaerisporangium melleum]GII72554.1 histidine kinase [Sphaerisporangium melleum]